MFPCCIRVESLVHLSERRGHRLNAQHVTEQWVCLSLSLFVWSAWDDEQHFRNLKKKQKENVVTSRVPVVHTDQVQRKEKTYVEGRTYSSALVEPYNCALDSTQ